MNSCSSHSKLLLSAFSAMLVCSLLPTVANASTFDTKIDAATSMNYQLYQAVLDSINLEYGSNAKLVPLSEYMEAGLPLPKAPTQDNLNTFRVNMGEQIEWAMTTSLDAQLACLNAYLDPTCTYFDGTLPDFDNLTPWAINTMLSLITINGYSHELVRFIADRNEAFSIAISQSNFYEEYIPEPLSSLSKPDYPSSGHPNGNTRGSVTHSLPHTAGTSKLTGTITIANGYWQWYPTATASWTIGLFWPKFAQYYNSKTLTSSSQIWNVTYTGQLTMWDPVNFIMSYTDPFTIFMQHTAGAAAIQAGYI